MACLDTTMLIAAGHSIITRNISHFVNIPELVVEQY